MLRWPTALCALAGTFAWHVAAPPEAGAQEKPAVTTPAVAKPVATPAVAKPAVAKPPAKPAVTKTAPRPAAKRPSAKRRAPPPRRAAPPRARTPRHRPRPRQPGSAPGQPDEGTRQFLTGQYARPTGTLLEQSPEHVAMRELDAALFPRQPPAAVAPLATTLLLPPVGPRVDASGFAPPPSRPRVELAPAADLAWLARLRMPDIPMPLDPSIVRYLRHYRDTPRGRSMVARFVQKAGRYRTQIERLLRHYQLPEDLLWVALIESAFDATAYSHAGAAGLWQFMPATARIYGLTVEKHVDERLDAERCTHAALRHLGDLHARFGTWELALAAYNMGFGGVLSSLRKYNTNDYWRLRQHEAALPYETALYVPKIFAMAIVARNCDVFGCDTVTPDAAQPFDEVAVGPGVPLDAVAEALGEDLATVRARNPHLLGSRTPPIEQAPAQRTSWSVYVPPGKSKLVREKLPTISGARASLGTHQVRWGESLARVAAAYDTDERWLARANDLHRGEQPRPGTYVFVPPGRTPTVAAPAGDRPVVVVPNRDFSYRDRRRVVYESVYGDTLDDIARVARVSADQVRRWNDLVPGARLQNGMTLQLFLPHRFHPKAMVLTEERDVTILRVESDAFFAYFEGQKGRRRVEVTVQEGESWASLSARYDLSLGMLERINHRHRSEALSPGERVVVYAKQKKPAKRASRAPVGSDDPS